MASCEGHIQDAGFHYTSSFSPNISQVSQRIITSQASRAFSHGIWTQPLSSYQLSLPLCFPLWQLTYLVAEAAYRRLAFRVCRRLQAEEGRIPASRFICCIVVVCSELRSPSPSSRCAASGSSVKSSATGIEAEADCALDVLPHTPVSPSHGGVYPNYRGQSPGSGRWDSWSGGRRRYQGSSSRSLLASTIPTCKFSAGCKR